MSGTIGLTASGQELDRYVTALTDRKLAGRINKFVGHATVRIQQAREYDDDVVMLALRAYYKQLATTLPLDPYPASLLQNYIHTLTKPGFQPTTRNRRSARHCDVNAGVPLTLQWNQMGLQRLAARLSVV